MTQKEITKTIKIVAPLFMAPFVIGIIETIMTTNEFALASFIFEKLFVPIIILSIGMSVYWLMLTDEFWDLRDGDTSLGTIAKAVFKFLIWVPGMALCFYVSAAGIVSIYNRTNGDKIPTEISGQIIDKNEASGRRGPTRYYFKIDDLKLKRAVKIQVYRSDYEQYNPGDEYTTERMVGALGFVYETDY